MKPARDRAGSGFAAGLGIVVAVFCAACLLVARREWFAFDDFFFLRYVQEAQPWVWLDPRAAMVERVWPFYRPIGMETFYYVGLRLFGLDAVDLFFRFALLAPAELPAYYSYAIGANLPRNLGLLLAHAFGGAPALGLAALLAAGIVWSARHSERTPPRALRRLLEANLFCVGWMAIVLLPFVALPSDRVRYATPLAAPVSLLLGSYLDLLWRAYAQRRGRLLEAALLGLLVVSLPYATLLHRARNPAGAQPKRLAEIMSHYTHEGQQNLRFLLLHGGPGLARSRAVKIFSRRLYGGGFIRAVYPDGRTTLRLVDVSEPLPEFGRYGPCVYLTLDEKSRVDVAERALLERVLPARLIGRCESRGER